jgi:hypothetical protein
MPADAPVASRRVGGCPLSAWRNDLPNIFRRYSAATPPPEVNGIGRGTKWANDAQTAARAGYVRRRLYGLLQGTRGAQERRVDEASWDVIRHRSGPDLLEACYFYAPGYPGAPGSCPPELSVVLMALTSALAVSLDHDARNFLSYAGTKFLGVTEQNGDIRGAEAACACWRAAISATADDDPDRPDYFAGLAMASLSLFEELGDRRDDPRYGGRISRLPAGHPGRPAALHNLATGLIDRGELADDLADLDEAVAAISSAHPEAADVLVEAITSLRAAVRNTAAPSAIRIAAARAWGAAAARAREWDLALEGYAAAITLLPLAAWHGLSRDDREQQLASWPGVARDAAACALQVGRPELAVEFLEQGRDVIWGQMLQTRADLTGLAASDPDLSLRLAETRRILDGADDGEGADVAGMTAAGRQDARRRSSERRMRAARDWDALLKTARALPGFRDFCRPVPFDRLIRAADDGPVVIINISQIRCDALIITRSGLRVLPLVALTWDSVMKHGDAYLCAIQRLTGYGEDDPGHREIVSRIEAIDGTLSWLWETIAEPVLAHLGHARTPDAGAAWPRVWWSATGPLSMLPIHAAGRDPGRSGGDTASVMDRVVSSYTPTLSALIRARRDRNPDAAPRRLLIVAMPTAPPDSGLPGLPGARAEAEWLAARFPLSHTRRGDDQAGATETLRLMQEHAIAHFTCHGSHEFAHPSRSGLLLRDGMLSIPRIAALDLSHAELAFLSACQTALGGVRLLDESVHLSAAFQLAGYRHVIGTLWTVADRSSADVVAEIYTALTGDSGEGLEALDVGRTAIALHHAVRRLRDRHRALALRWIPYLHIGP